MHSENRSIAMRTRSKSALISLSRACAPPDAPYRQTPAESSPLWQAAEQLPML
jgi:hypothetical protein